MRYFSTFSGIGGFELGIQQAYETLCNADRGEDGRIKADKERDKGQGFQPSARKDVDATKRSARERFTNVPHERPLCVGYSEIDKYATTIYQKHFPNHKNYGDITKIEASLLPDFDMLVGGFPCQAFSIAGKRGGFEDTRGTMFFELARIIREKQPRLFVFENVKGLLSHDEGRTFTTIITTLDELGYDLEWQVLNSKNHGVPQNRERVFIIGHLRGTSRPEVFPFGGDGGKTNELPRHVSNTLTARYEGAQAVGTYVGEGELNAQEIHQLNQPTHSNDRVYAPEGISPTLNTMQGGNRQPFVSIDTKQQGEPRYTKHVATLGANDWKEPKKVTNGTMIRRLTPIECERLQGFPDSFTELGTHDGQQIKISDSQRYKCLGNAVTVNVIRDIMLRLV